MKLSGKQIPSGFETFCQVVDGMGKKDGSDQLDEQT